MTDESLMSLVKELRLLRVETSKQTAATTQLTAIMNTMAHDVRATREKVNVIEARTPFPRSKKAAGA